MTNSAGDRHLGKSRQTSERQRQKKSPKNWAAMVLAPTTPTRRGNIEQRKKSKLKLAGGAGNKMRQNCGNHSGRKNSEKAGRETLEKREKLETTGRKAGKTRKTWLNQSGQSAWKNSAKPGGVGITVRKNSVRLGGSTRNYGHAIPSGRHPNGQVAVSMQQSAFSGRSIRLSLACAASRRCPGLPRASAWAGRLHERFLRDAKSQAPAGPFSCN